MHSECLTKEALDELGQIIETVKYADDLVIMAKEETVLQGMIDKLIEIGSGYENFKATLPSNKYDRPKATGEC